MFKGKNILVAGGAGFIGSNLCARLDAQGCQVRATFHKRTPDIKSSNIDYVQADLTLLSDCHQVVQDMDYVFMCAASTSGAAVIAHSPLVHVTPNIVMNAQMLDAAYTAKVQKFVFISSSIVYPSSGSRANREEEWLTDDPYEAYYAAGWMKRYGEILCKVYSEKLSEPMISIVVRPSNLFGPYDKYDFARSHFLAALLRRVVERHDPIEVWGSGQDVRDLLYIDDFIEGMLCAFERVDGYNPINLAYGKGYTVKEVLDVLIRVDGFENAQVVFNASKPSTIPIRLVDTSKAKRLLGFSAQTSLEEGLKKTLKWYREHHGIEKMKGIRQELSTVA